MIVFACLSNAIIINYILNKFVGPLLYVLRANGCVPSDFPISGALRSSAALERGMGEARNCFVTT